MKARQKLFFYIINIVFFSQVYMYPLNAKTRFSMGIVVLNFILLLETRQYFKKILPFCILFIPLERFIYYTILEQMTIINGFNKATPILGYYCGYMFFIYIFYKIDDAPIFKKSYILLIADILSNLIEFSIRGEISHKVVIYIILASLIRVISAFLIYLIYKNNIMLITKEIHQKKYFSLNILVSSLEAELFYLKKSKDDIEDIMKKSHSLYLLEGIPNEIKEISLDIAREVHEVKKDYIRITQGIESHLRGFNNKNHLSLKSLSEVIRSGTISYIEKNNKNIEFHMEINGELLLSKYQFLFIIINNLLTNSIDAIKSDGKLSLTLGIQEEYLLITVKDSGKGIPERNIPLLFNTGFTTKYNKDTGEMNTGLGLSHVKNILDAIDGSIEVNSFLSNGTTFKVSIPCTSIKKGV